VAVTRTSARVVIHLTVIETPNPCPRQTCSSVVKVDHANQRSWLLVATLSVVALTVAVLQTSVVPVLAVIARQLQASEVGVSWVITANLLSAVATTPLIGRLADRHSKKRVLLGVLAVVLVGSLIATATTSIAWLIFARVLQGASFSLYPVAVSILREELPPDRLMQALAVISGTLGVGGGTGLVVTGLLMTGDAEYHRVFWVTTVFTMLVLIAVVLVVPARPPHTTGTVDWAGAVGLALGLSALLIGITQGQTWGWTSIRTAGSILAGFALLWVWWRWERRCQQPLVSLAMLSRGPILLTNIATVLVGTGLYFGFLGVTSLAQAPISSGYGFGATVLTTSLLFQFPGAMAGFVATLVSGRYIDRFGARAVLIAGSAIGAVGYGLLAVPHLPRWEVIGAAILISVYISLAYGALPSLIIREVDASETGVATSMNAIARTLGAALAAALVAVLLSRTRHGYEPEVSYSIIFGMGAATACAAILLIVLSARTRTHTEHIESADDIAKSREMNHEWG